MNWADKMDDCLRFLEYDQQVFQRLLCFIKEKESKQPLDFYQNGKFCKIQALNIENILLQNFTNFWVLGCTAKKTASSICHAPQFCYYKIESLSKVDDILSWIADNFQWAIFPWGCDVFNLLGVLSTEADNKQEFHKLITELSGHQIVKYEFEKTINTEFHSLVFDEESEVAGTTISKLCNLESTLPIIATMDLSSLENVYDIHTACYEEIAELVYEGNFKYFLYKPKDIESYEKICNVFYGLSPEVDSMPFTVMFPGNTNVEAIDQCLKFLIDESRTIVSSMMDLIELAEWVWVINVGDFQLWFATKNYDKIRAIGNSEESIELFCCV